MLPLPVIRDGRVADPTVVSVGAVSFGVSLKEVPTVVLVLWLLLGSWALGFMISSDVPGLLVAWPVTRPVIITGDAGSPMDHVVPPYVPSLSSPVGVATGS